MLIVLSKIKILCKDPLIIESSNLIITLKRGVIKVECKVHNCFINLLPFPIIGVSVGSNLRLLKREDYIVTMRALSISDELSTNLYLTVCGDSLVLTSEVRPVKSLIPINLIMPYVKISLDDTWQVKLSSMSSRIHELEEVTPLMNANILQLMNNDCTFSIFAGRCTLVWRDKCAIIYPKIYIKQLNSSYTIGLCYSNIPPNFKAQSSIAICHESVNSENLAR